MRLLGDRLLVILAAALRRVFCKDPLRADQHRDGSANDRRLFVRGVRPGSL